MSLPIEIWELIIDHLGWQTEEAGVPSGRTDLHHCALVCRAWRRRAQVWVFKSPTLSAVLSLPEAVPDCRRADDILSLVREVRVSCGKEEMYSVSPVASISANAIGIEEPLRYNVFIEGDALNSPIPRTISSFYVTGLDLCKVQFKQFSNLCRLLYCFPQLKVLSFEDVECAELNTDICVALQGHTGRRFLGNLNSLSVCTTMSLVDVI